MKKTIFRLIFFGIGVMLFVFAFRQAEARPQSLRPASVELSYISLQTTSSPPENTPQVVAVTVVTADRELPPVGKDVGMVLGASLLVLIIIGGVLGSRKRAKH